MKRKQIKTYLFACLIVVSSAVSIVATGFGSSTTSQTANAYVCPQQFDTPPVYEYHDDGKCWKLNYAPLTGADAPKAPQTQVVNGINQCPGGGAPNSGPNGKQCAVTCASGDAFHQDTNQCFHHAANDFTVEDTQKVAPTTNDGKPLNITNAKCTDGFTYLQDNGNGQGGAAGCYMKVGNSFPCPANKIQTSHPGYRDVTFTCDDTGKDHLIPADPSKDTSVCANGVQASNTCKPFSDYGDSSQDCDTHGGRFKMTSGMNTTDPKDDVYSCTQPTEAEKACQQQYTGQSIGASVNSDNAYKNRIDQRNACYDGASGQACTQTDQAQKAACENGKKAADKASGQSTFDTKTWDNIKTNLIDACKGTGIEVLGGILKMVINILTLLVGIAAVGGITWEALQYAQAQDDSSTVTNARNRIRDIIIGVLVYGLMIAIVNWLVPGGVIGS